MVLDRKRELRPGFDARNYQRSISVGVSKTFQRGPIGSRKLGRGSIVGNRAAGRKGIQHWQNCYTNGGARVYVPSDKNTANKDTPRYSIFALPEKSGREGARPPEASCSHRTPPGAVSIRSWPSSRIKVSAVLVGESSAVRAARRLKPTMKEVNDGAEPSSQRTEALHSNKTASRVNNLRESVGMDSTRETVRCVVCGAPGRVSPEIVQHTPGTLRWLCDAHSSQMGALLGGEPA